MSNATNEPTDAPTESQSTTHGSDDFEAGRHEDPPDTVRDLPVTSDSQLLPEEKELRIVGPNDLDNLHIATEIPPHIRWVLSVEESDLNWIRVNEDGAIIAISARVPKGIVKLQGSARKSDHHSAMVTYGDARGSDQRDPDEQTHD
jgi:hypothetical protein